MWHQAHAHRGLTTGPASQEAMPRGAMAFILHLEVEKGASESMPTAPAPAALACSERRRLRLSAVRLQCGTA